MKIVLDDSFPEEEPKVLYSGSGGMIQIQLENGTRLNIKELADGAMLDINLETGRICVMPRASNVIWVGAHKIG